VGTEIKRKRAGMEIHLLSADLSVCAWEEEIRKIAV
jgi:hypothetical protein